MTITCSKCGDFLELNRLGLQSYCRPCASEYSRVYLSTYKAPDPEAKEKKRCRALVGIKIRKGVIAKQPCSVCGNPESEAHHEDYSKPLEIIWFCRQCHVDLHTQRNREKALEGSKELSN